MKLFPDGESRGKAGVRLLVFAAMTAIGVLHFARAAAFIAIVPDYLPAPGLLVQVSGACEIAGGLGLLVASVRRAAAFGLAALFVAVFPANVYMATHHIAVEGVRLPDALLWGRLPLQLLLIGTAVWLASPSRARDRSGSRSA